jgi:lactose/L-arabinose transport system ATP-binding protein
MGGIHSLDMRIEKLRGMSFAYLRSSMGERLIIAEDGESDLTDDMDVGVRFDPARAYLFDAETGHRLR